MPEEKHHFSHQRNNWFIAFLSLAILGIIGFLTLFTIQSINTTRQTTKTKAYEEVQVPTRRPNPTIRERNIPEEGPIISKKRVIEKFFPNNKSIFNQSSNSDSFLEYGMFFHWFPCDKETNLNYTLYLSKDNNTDKYEYSPSDLEVLIDSINPFDRPLIYNKNPIKIDYGQWQWLVQGKDPQNGEVICESAKTDFYIVKVETISPSDDGKVMPLANNTIPLEFKAEYYDFPGFTLTFYTKKDNPLHTADRFDFYLEYLVPIGSVIKDTDSKYTYQLPLEGIGNTYSQTTYSFPKNTSIYWYVTGWQDKVYYRAGGIRGNEPKFTIQEKQERSSSIPQE